MKLMQKITFLFLSTSPLFFHAAEEVARTITKAQSSIQLQALMDKLEEQLRISKFQNMVTAKNSELVAHCEGLPPKIKKQARKSFLEILTRYHNEEESLLQNTDQYNFSQVFLIVLMHSPFVEINDSQLFVLFSSLDIATQEKLYHFRHKKIFKKD